jgi:hypothetical protein
MARPAAVLARPREKAERRIRWNYFSMIRILPAKNQIRQV